MLTPEARVQQLSEQEAALLYTDGPNANGNVTLVHIYDQSTAPGGKVRFKAVLDHIEGRLARLPILRRKLLRVPLELDYPYWVEDKDFSLEYHVRFVGPWRVWPGDGCCAEWTQCARWCYWLVCLSIGLGNVGFLSTGANRECVPRLAGIVNAISDIAIRILSPSIESVDIAA